MKEEIEKIIYDKKMNLIDKVIEIAKIVDGKNFDPKKIAEGLNIPLSMITDPVEMLIPAEMPKSNIKEYISIFDQAYRKMNNNLAYKFAPADIGQIKNILRLIKIDIFNKIIDYLLYRWTNRTQVKYEFEISTIMNNFKPVKIYNNLNYLIKESEKNGSGVGGWGYGIKGGKK